MMSIAEHTVTYTISSSHMENPRWGPGTAAWFYFGAPSSAAASPAQAKLPRSESFAFQISPSYSSDGSSADELFRDGQISPRKLPCPLDSTRDIRSLHQRSLSLLSPKRNNTCVDEEPLSRSSSSGRNSWHFIKDLVHRSEGTRAASTVKERLVSSMSFKDLVQHSRRTEPPPRRAGAAAGGEAVGKRQSTAQSQHELRRYVASRAASYATRKRTSLPHREGLFACLG